MHKLLKLISSQPMRLVLTIAIAFLTFKLIPHEIKRIFLTFSFILKEILIFMIPFIIFSSVYSAFAKIRGNALSFMVLLLVCIVSSNFFSVGIAGVFSYFIVFTGDVVLHRPETALGMAPLWELSIPKLVPNNVVLLFSLILACISYPKIEKRANKLAKFTAKIVDIFLKKFFVPLLPIFIFGFLLKLLSDDIIGDVLAVNPQAFVLMIIVLLVYLSIILYMAVIFYRKKAGDILRNIAAPFITAFTCMSSAAALPFSIKAAEANTKNKNVADVVMPATVNIHMIGDSIIIPTMAMILLMAFGHTMPDPQTYLIFAMTFVITKFSGAGVPGGSILVMIPVLESCLGFTAEMTALITICYMLLDPICTSGNVTGNNLFVIHFNKLYGWITKKSKKI